MRIAEYKGRKLATKEAEQARGARQPLPLRNQQPLDHRRHAAQQYRALLQPFLQSERGSLRRQAPGVHPHAAQHQAGRGNHLRLRHRLSQERDRALELQMRPLPAAARPQGARTAARLQERRRSGSGLGEAEMAKNAIRFAPARRRGHARRIIPSRRQRPITPVTSDSLDQRLPAARADRVPRGILYMLARHRDVRGLHGDREMAGGELFVRRSAVLPLASVSLVVCAVLILPRTGLDRVPHAPPARSYRPQRHAGSGAEPDHRRLLADAARRRHRHQFLRAAVRHAVRRALAQGKSRPRARLRADRRLPRRAAGGGARCRQLPPRRAVRARQCGAVRQRHRGGARHDHDRVGGNADHVSDGVAHGVLRRRHADLRH